MEFSSQATAAPDSFSKPLASTATWCATHGRLFAAGPLASRGAVPTVIRRDLGRREVHLESLKNSHDLKGCGFGAPRAASNDEKANNRKKAVAAADR